MVDKIHVKLDQNQTPRQKFNVANHLLNVSDGYKYVKSTNLAKNY